MANNETYSTSPTLGLFAPDRHEIETIGDWRRHAGPQKKDHWRVGFSAVESARAWMPDGSPAVPAEILAALSDAGVGDFDEVYARPEHKTKLDDFPRARQHDVFACLRSLGSTVAVVGVEAKAREDYDGYVADRAGAPPPSNKRARCNLMSRALFDREVFGPEPGDVLDPELVAHGYQLWTAAVGSIREAQERGVDTAVEMVHQLRPVDPAGLDQGHWEEPLARNGADFDLFAAAIADAGGRSFETPFVAAGVRIVPIKVETEFASHEAIKAEDLRGVLTEMASGTRVKLELTDGSIADATVLHAAGHPELAIDEADVSAGEIEQLLIDVSTSGPE